ncbi:MAG: MotA/TolQ/ExbB proton channel family protein [Marinicellaceae bacterium]
MKNFLLLLLLSSQINPTFAQETESQSTAIENPEPLPEVDENQAALDIQKAYQKEYAFLTAQVKNIKARTAEFKSTAKTDKLLLNQQIARLENEMLDLDNVNNQLEDDIFQIQRNTDSAVDNNNLLEATITQAKSTLSEFKFNAFDDDSEWSAMQKIESLILFAKDIIINQSNVSQNTGTFFLQSGKEVNGSIVKVGNIASYGYSPEGSGVLAPAGENKFKVWRDSDNAIVEDFFESNSATQLPIFIYESSLKQIEEKQDKTVLSVIESGGIIAWIITILGLFALLLIVLRFWFLKRASSSTEKILNKVVTNIENEDMEAAIKVATKKKSSSSRILYAVLRNITRDREHIEDVVSESILHESSQLNRFGSMIMVVATVAPLLGLLGTVTGMISTFDIITEFGTGDPKLLSSGISIALVTTEIGLAVAIPTLLFGNVLSGWAERIKDDMEKAALRVINVYKKSYS